MKTKKEKGSGLGVLPEARLYEQAQRGCQESLGLLMARHEPLVWYATNRQNLGDFPRQEAVQAGRIGLWKAILGFDPQRGYQFSTYAYPAIVHNIWVGVKGHCVANQQAHATQEWALFFRHWETGPAQRQAEQEVRTSLAAMVAGLPERLRQIIAVRYELDGEKWQSYRQHAREMGYSHEWVRQLEIQALVWMRHPAHSQELRELLQRHSLQEYEWAEEVAQAWLRRRGGRDG